MSSDAEKTNAQSDLPLLAVTLGDPSGIGPEVAIKGLGDQQVSSAFKPVLIGNFGTVMRTAGEVGSSLVFKKIRSVSEARDAVGFVPVMSIGGQDDSEFPIGAHSPISGLASHRWVQTAAEMCNAGEVDGMVTGPVNKESWQMSGAPDLGHQEVFKRLTNSSTVYTMLVSGTLRCMHLSTHKSLAEACKFVTADNVLTATRMTHKSFVEWGIDSPRIAVAALNPHASDNGLIGDTEAREITPAIDAAKSEGIDASGPVPADSVFNQAIAGRYDVVVVMYHDQGHIPIKVHGFEESVSVNLGIPFIRTSVDHGTAFDIAGQNRAQSVSMVEAIKLAVALSTKRGIG